MLRLASAEKIVPVTILDTTFYLKSISLEERQDLLDKIAESRKILEILDVVCKIIDRIDGYEGTPREILGQLEFFDDFKKLIEGIINHCTLTDEESKNLSSSLEPPSQDSSRSVEKNVEQEDEPVLNFRD